MIRMLSTLGAMILLTLSVSSPISAQTSTVVVAVEHTTTADIAVPGAPVAFTVRLTNESAETVTGITVEVQADDLLTNLERINLAVGLGSGNPVDGQLVRWPDQTLGPNESTTLRYRGVVDPNIGRRTEAMVNMVSVAAGGRPAVTGAVELPLRRAADSITPTHRQTESSELVRPGETVSYLLDIENTSDIDVTDVEVRVPFDPDLLAVVPDDGFSIDDGDLVWSIGDLAARQAPNQLAYDVVADRSFSPDVNPLPIVVEAGGSTRHYLNDVVQPAASNEQLSVRHEAQLLGSWIEPGDEIEYVIEVSNVGSDASFENLVVILRPDWNVFRRDGISLDPGNEGVVAEPSTTTDEDDLQWPMIERLDPGATREFRYKATARSQFFEQADVENAVEVTAGEETISRTSSDAVALATAGDLLDVTHSTNDGISPDGTISFTVTLTNSSPVADIVGGADGIVVKINPDGDVFTSAQWNDQSTGEQTELELTRLGKGQSQSLVYEAKVRSSPGDLDDVENRVEVSIGGTQVKVVPNGSIDLAARGGSDGDSANDPGIEGLPLFFLIMAFLFLSFASFIAIMFNKSDTRGVREEVGFNLFAIISLVSATLILAFGTRVGDEALSLLAAIAGYVLGRQFSSSDRGPSSNNGGSNNGGSSDGDGGHGDGGDSTGGDGTGGDGASAAAGSATAAPAATAPAATAPAATGSATAAPPAATPEAGASG